MKNAGCALDNRAPAGLFVAEPHFETGPIIKDPYEQTLTTLTGTPAFRRRVKGEQAHPLVLIPSAAIRNWIFSAGVPPS